MKAERSVPKETMANVPNMTADRDRVKDRRVSRSNGSGGVWNAVLALVVVMLVGALYFLWTEYEVTRVEMVEANQRLAALENQLISTGDEMSQSDAAVRVQLNGLDKEVRRLEQNRKKDKELLLQHAKSVKNLTTRTANTNKKQSAVVSQVTSMSAQLDEVVETLDGVNFEVLRVRLDKVFTSLETVNKQLSDIEKTQADINERFDSNDAFRRQVNARLSAIENPASQAPQLQ